MNFLEYKTWAQPLALSVEEQFKIPADYAITQSAHESANGNSGLATEHKNYFGMTAGDNWLGKIAALETTEYHKLPPDKIRWWNRPGDIKEKILLANGGSRLTVLVDFRKYDNALDSFLDWGKKIHDKYPKAYAAALKLDALGFFHEIAAAGYATDTDYEKKLVSLFQKVQEATV